MLLGLAAAVLLAMLLQLNALRARRPEAFECAGDGVIHLKAWVVLETLETPEASSPAQLAAKLLRAPIRFVRAARRQFARPTPWRQILRARFWREPPKPHGARPAEATGPPTWTSRFCGERWRSPRPPDHIADRVRRPPGPPRRAFC